MIKTLFTLALAITFQQIAFTQSSNWARLASDSDSATFEKLIDPKEYSISTMNVEKIKEWQHNSSISGDSLFRLLSNWNTFPEIKQTGIVIKLSADIDSNYSVPFFVYVPKNYNPKQKTVLLVYYKGGWLARRELPNNFSKEIIIDNPTLAYLDEYNVVEVFPALKSDLAIYGNYGYRHLSGMIKETKKRFNIDDNKVFLAGYSDGGKTVYNASYLAQTTVACFYPINGAVVSPPFFPNWYNRPIFSIVAKRDELTDPRSIRSKAKHAVDRGANWIYRELDKTHYYKPYAHEILPALFQHMMQTNRNPFPTRIVYDRSFNDVRDFPGVDWLQMEVNTKKAPSPNHFTDSIQTFAGDGEERNYRYGENVGQVRAVFFDNVFTVTTSQVDKLILYISPLMVNMNLPVKIILNGKEVFNNKVEYSKEFMTEKFLNDFDRGQVFVNQIVIDVP
ncbi:MAG: hypothetical protein NVV59_17945 [Chitinophagaceae bacterium]|nr:hypothetical protein [Chitinophagaceae bacterium]